MLVEICLAYRTSLTVLVCINILESEILRDVSQDWLDLGERLFGVFLLACSEGIVLVVLVDAPSQPVCKMV